MNAAGKRLGFALQFTASANIFNVYMVLTGAGVVFYDHMPGTDAQAVAQAPFQGCINSHAVLSPNDTQIHSSKFMPELLNNRG
jgi:hypothetical protein